MTAGREPHPSFDVAIVGYGPTGATLANLVALCGLTVVVLERETDVYHLPRAVHFDDETMRVFQTVGIAGRLRQRVRVNPGMRFVDGEGRLLMDWPRPAGPGPQGWHASYRLHQPDLEVLLRRALARRPGATVLAGCEATGLSQTAGAVEVTCRDRSGGDRRTVRAGYVVGCDGARSFVRQAIGSAMEDLGFRERWLVVDLVLKRTRPDLGDHTVQHCRPDRPVTYCRNPGKRRRWEIAVLDDETDEAIARPERVWHLLSDWIGPDDADVERSAVYTFRSALAGTWRNGRVLIAGDAAHLTPPFMGQGMCTGIRDAANLAWKLALCAHGRAGLALLDSYQAERRPHAGEYVATAIQLGGLVNSLDRDGALAMAKQAGPGGATMKSIAPRLGPADLPGFSPPPSAHRGQLFAQPVLADGRLMDDACGYNPVLVTRKPPARRVASGMRVLSAVDEPSLSPVLDGLDADAVLVRPDRYILATARGDAEVAALAAIRLPSPDLARR